MTLLKKYGAFTKTFAGTIENVGLLAFVLMMAVTTVDVVGAKLWSTPLKGSIDLVMLLQSVAITFAAGSTFVAGQHIAVEFFLNMVSERYRNILKCACDVIGFVFFGVLVLRLLAYGLSLYEGNEVSPTIRVPLHPFAFGAAFGCTAVCLIYLDRVLTCFSKGQDQ